MLNILLGLLFLCIIFAAAYWIITLLITAQPFRNIAYAILAIFLVILLIGVFTGGITWPVFVR